MATDWNQNLPSGGIAFNQGDNDIRKNNGALQDALAREHNFPGDQGIDAGRHTFGVGGSTTRDAAITSPSDGNMWFNTDFGSGLLQVYISGAWVTIGSGVTGMIAMFASDSDPAGASDPPTAGSIWLPAWDGDEVAVADFGNLAAYLGATGGGGGTSVWDNFRGQSNPGAGNFRLPKLSKQILYAYDPLDPEYDAAGDRPSTVDEQTLVEANIPLYDPATTSNGQVAISEDKRSDADFGGGGTVVHDVNTEAYDPGDFGQASPDPIENRPPFYTLAFMVKL